MTTHLIETRKRETADIRLSFQTLLLHVFAIAAVKPLLNRDFAFFVFERTKHQPRRNLRSYLVLQRLCNEAALSPGIDAFWY